MGILRALARTRATRSAEIADSLRRQIDDISEGSWVSAREDVPTPAGLMRLRAAGSAGPGGGVDLAFARVTPDGRQIHYSEGPTQGAGTARASIQAIEQALERLLADTNPAALTFSPTSPSRSRLYASLLARRAYRRTDANGQSERWERALTDEERAQADSLNALRDQMGAARSTAYFWDDVDRHIGPVDNALTYGAPAAAVGGAGYALHQDMQNSDGLRAQQYGLIQRALRRAIANGER